MKECLDEGKLQGFFDGELSPDMMEQAARHVTLCPECAQALREVESESAIFLTAIAAETSAPVPTEQLRTRIETAIAQSQAAARARMSKSWAAAARSWVASLVDGFVFTPQRAGAFAAVLAILILGSIYVRVQLRNTQGFDDDLARQVPPVRLDYPGLKTLDNPKATVGLKALSNSLVAVTRPRQRTGGTSSNGRDIKLIPGEQSYLRTIAVLGSDLKQSGEQTMTPAARAEYERNLRLVDDAIAVTRSRAKRSPHDPDAADFMFAAYQSKVDLLNTYTEQARLTRDTR
jgi:hypothetical protein